MSSIPMAIRGESVALRTLAPVFSDMLMLRDAVAPSLNGSGERLPRWLAECMKSPENCRRQLAICSIDYELGNGVMYGVFASGACHGYVEAFGLSAGNRQAELAFWMARVSRGRGYMTEAVGLMERSLASCGAADSFLIACRPANAPSIRVAEKCGYAPSDEARGLGIAGWLVFKKSRAPA
ncbi:hypothetical protein FACS1894186_6980 [Alphaproteobacteria bacterium]|nr:hypothetical protein FACS1894186_6980 [Alphaproteobacteria bacterium]